MSMGESKYNFSLTTFSPTGKLGQIESALRAVQDGSDSIGIKCKHGVVLASEKRMKSVLQDESTHCKSEELCEGIGCVFSGLSPDFRVLVRAGRKRAQVYKSIYGTAPPCSQLCQSMANIMQEYTQSGGVRPFGVSMLIAGYDGTTPQLFQVDPSGIYFGWKATAIGKNFSTIKNQLEKRYSEDCTLETAINLALLTLRDVADNKLTAERLELSVVDNSGKFRKLSDDEIRDALEYLD